METPQKERGHGPDPGRLKELVAHLFAYKAEWLDHELYELFSEPAYFSALRTNQSCVLIGGRGTGKTTVLRGLSYEGQLRLTKKEPHEWDSFGLYYKVDANRISALSGLGMTDDEWQRPFGHYLNLLISHLATRFLDWLQNQLKNEAAFSLTSQPWRSFERSLGLRFPHETERTWTIGELAESVEGAVVDFELYINNIRDEGPKPPLSIAAGPIDRLFDAFQTLPVLRGRSFFILIDEYESFSDLQQQVVNTLVKQSAGKQYCFKIGVRELGWRVRHTLNGQELRDPSDYRRIDIAEHFKDNKFKRFARNICNERLARLWEAHQPPGAAGPLGVRELLPGLSVLREAEFLGVGKRFDEILRNVEDQLTVDEVARLREIHPARTWFAAKWAGGEGPVENLRSLLKKPGLWDGRFVNHGYASLFAIRPGRTGIRKYYAGWDVFTVMAAGNIRFLLQLAEEALRLHLSEGAWIDVPVVESRQTEAATNVGLRNFEELEGIDIKGAKIMRLVLGVGRLFQIFAYDPFGHAPEVNQFFVGESDSAPEELRTLVDELLKASVNHLALQRATATKLGSEDPKGTDYWVHPVFSAFLEISHRKKRKTTFSYPDVEGLVESQRKTIKTILGRSKRASSSFEAPPIPSQLRLFFSPEEEE